ncbi:hypothetical protein C8R45DRAFT_1099366 [Mycena sanguinolenta]|nr:hypothetical protein C8R45DRAFT_1099366 [Mycena sanguinolenta]
MQPSALAASQHTSADLDYLDSLSARQLMEFRNHLFHPRYIETNAAKFLDNGFNPKYIEMNATKFLDHRWININLLRDYFGHASHPPHATSTLDPIHVKTEAPLLTVKLLDPMDQFTEFSDIFALGASSLCTLFASAHAHTHYVASALHVILACDLEAGLTPIPTLIATGTGAGAGVGAGTPVNEDTESGQFSSYCVIA